jgi:hypothetical protein
VVLFVAAAALALYLAASTVAGTAAGVIAGLCGAVGLAASARMSSMQMPCTLALIDGGAVQWTDRRGRRATGTLVSASRVGGLWVVLHIRASTAARPIAAHLRRTGRTRAWLISADALDREAFRALAARVSRTVASG